MSGSGRRRSFAVHDTASIHTMDKNGTVYLIDDDDALRRALTLFMETEGFTVKAFASARSFLDFYEPGWKGCIILDIGMPEMDGLDLQQRLIARGNQLPIIFLTGQGDIPRAVQAVKSGAVDFLEKPASNEEILARIRTAMVYGSKQGHSADQITSDLHSRYGRLTERQQQVMSLVTSGRSNKEVARTLGISTRTAEGHRLRVMEKMQASSLQELTEMAAACKVMKSPHAASEH
jgi:FixJ family two-component response regulator